MRAVVAEQLDRLPPAEAVRRRVRAPGRGGPAAICVVSAVTGALSTDAGSGDLDVDGAVDRRPHGGVGVASVDVPLDAVDLDRRRRRRRSRPGGRRRRPARSAGRPTRRRTGVSDCTRREGSPASSSGSAPISAGQDASASGRDRRDLDRQDGQVARAGRACVPSTAARAGAVRLVGAAEDVGQDDDRDDHRDQDGGRDDGDAAQRVSEARAPAPSGRGVGRGVARSGALRC